MNFLRFITLMKADFFRLFYLLFFYIDIYADYNAVYSSIRKLTLFRSQSSPTRKCNHFQRLNL